MTEEEKEMVDDVRLALMHDRDINHSAFKVARNQEDAAHCSRNVRRLDLAIKILKEATQ